MNLKQFLQFINRSFRQRIEPILKKYNEDLPLRVLPYIMQNMWPGQNPAGINARNTTDKLYRRTGTLVQALRKGGAGNISRITINQNSTSLEYGIDVSTVPYALFHETGTRKMRARPYLRPGIEEFRKRALEQIQQDLLRKLKQEWDKSF